MVPQRTGRGSLVVKNDGRRDSVIVLAQANSTERAFYIRAGEQVTVLNVAPGTYQVMMMIGDEWTDDHFARNAAYEQLERPVEFAEQTNGDTTEFTRLNIAFRPGVVGASDRRAVSPFTLGSPLSSR